MTTPDDQQWSDEEIEASRNRLLREQLPVIDGIDDVSQEEDLFPLDVDDAPPRAFGITITAATIQRGTKAAMLAAARKFLGMGEDPPGSNWNAIVDWFNKRIARIGRGAWCDMAVTEAAYDSGNENAVLGGGNGRGFAYVPSHMAWGAAKYGLHWGSVPPAGAVVGYRWDGRKGSTICDHIGVSERDRRDGTFDSLEGNTGDRYKRQHRDLTYVSCWFMPKYGTETTTEDILKTLVDLGAEQPQTIKAGQRGSISYELEYTGGDPGKIHTDKDKDGRYPSIFPAGGDAPYGVTAEVALAAPPHPGVKLAVAQYERKTNKRERDIRTQGLAVANDVLHANVRMSDKHKYRIDLINDSDQDVTVERAYLLITH